jgi:hypothetical protein
MVQLQLSALSKNSIDHTDEFEIIEVETEEVTSFTEIMPVTPPPFKIKNEPFDTALDSLKKMD